MTRIIFCMFMFIMEELIFPVKGFFTEDALEDLFQSKALLEKKKAVQRKWTREKLANHQEWMTFSQES